MGNLAVVSNTTDVDDLKQYPIPKGERLEAHSFFAFHYDRFLNSSLYLLGDWDVKGVALALWCKAQDQDPVGTLPTDRRLIAALINMTTDDFDKLCKREFSPLHNWVHCLVGNETRLMHPTVTEVAQNAFDQKYKGKDRATADQERQRIKRLKASVKGLVGERMALQEMFIGQLDKWLEEAYPSGNRTLPRIMEGLDALGVRDLSLK